MNEERCVRSTRCEFSFTESGELSRIVFVHPLLSAPRISVRNRWRFGKESTGTFQWSSAVRGLAALVLKTLLEGDASLEGHGGSLCASLDYAISKRPDWLKTVFGVDDRGNPLSDRLFLRENPERKREGAVTIKLSALLPRACIAIRRGSIDVTHCSEQLSSLLERIEAPAHNSSTQSRDNSGEGSWAEIMTASIEALSSQSLRDRGAFVSSERLERLSRIASSPYLRAVGGKALGPVLNSLNGTPVPDSTRLGLCDYDRLRSLWKSHYRTVACPVSLPESLLLFAYLKWIKRLPLHIDWQHAYAIPLAKAVSGGTKNREPHFVALGLVPSLTYRSKGFFRKYSPTFLLPFAHHTTLSAQESDRHTGLRKHSSIMMVCDEPATTVLFGHEALWHIGVDPRAVTFIHREPDELAFECARRSTRNSSLVAMTLFAEVNRGLFGMITSASQSRALSPQHSVLYSHASLNSELIQQFNLALSDAWHSLSAYPALRAQTISALLQEDGFLDYVARATGAIHCDRWERLVA